MNKKMLLTGAAVLALTISSAANADSVYLKGSNGSNASATIHPTVDLVGTFGLENSGDLKFGVIVNPQAGQSVTIDANGNVSGGGDVVLLGENVTTTPGARATQTVQAGSLTVSGALDTLVARTGNGGDIQSIQINMPDEAINLYIDGNGAKCGTIAVIPDITIEANKTTYTYGGTLTLDANVAGLSGHCQPATDPQVTLVMNPAVIAPAGD